LPYELVVDGELQTTSDKAFLLSPEDLEASDVATDLWNLAVSSLKIEGRLKGPAYVGAAVRLYRAALDRHSPHGSGERASTHGSDDVRQAALQHFSRGSGPGFFRGVDHQRLVEGRSSDHRGLQVGVVRTVVRRADRDWIVLESSARALAATTEDARPGSPTLAPDALERSAGILVEGGFGNEGEVGGRIWNIVRDGDAVRVWLGPDKAVPVRTDQTSNLQGRRVFRTSAPQVERRTLDALRDAPAKRPLRFELVAREGEFPNLVATTGDGIRRSCVVQAPWVRATSRQVDEALLADKLGRLKDSPFEFAGVAVQADVPGVVPFGAINRARRELVDALIDARPTAYATTERSATALVGEARSRIASSLPLPRAAEDRACSQEPSSRHGQRGAPERLPLHSTFSNSLEPAPPCGSCATTQTPRWAWPRHASANRARRRSIASFGNSNPTSSTCGAWARSASGGTALRSGRTGRRSPSATSPST
jgi:putative protease